jgi:hypothetical protein
MESAQDTIVALQRHCQQLRLDLDTSESDNQVLKADVALLIEQGYSSSQLVRLCFLLSSRILKFLTEFFTHKQLRAGRQHVVEEQDGFRKPVLIHEDVAIGGTHSESVELSPDRPIQALAPIAVPDGESYDSNSLKVSLNHQQQQQQEAQTSNINNGSMVQTASTASAVLSSTLPFGTPAKSSRSALNSATGSPESDAFLSPQAPMFSRGPTPGTTPAR